MKFRKKPVEVESVQFTGTNGDEIAEFMGCQYPCMENGALLIGTLAGVMRASPGDWIIKGIKGEFYPCKPEIFTATYDNVADTPRLQDAGNEMRRAWRVRLENPERTTEAVDLGGGEIGLIWVRKDGDREVRTVVKLSKEGAEATIVCIYKVLEALDEKSV